MSRTTGLAVLAVVLLVGAWSLRLLAPRPDLTPVPQGHRATQELVDRFGNPKFSQYFEESIARDFFHDQRGGVFLDVGAGDALFNSTTAYLERDLGWTGIAIDADPKHLEGFLKERRGSRFFAYFVSDTDGARMPFYINDVDWRVSSGSKAFADERGRSHTVEVPTITLNTLLKRENVERIDFLSMDIEQGEPAALAGFDIRKYAPRLACIEMQPVTRDRIHEYMVRNGWVEIEKYRKWDWVNRYYTPGPGVAAATATGRAAQP